MKQKVLCRFLDLVRPDCAPYSVEQYFGIYRWMVETAHAIQPTKAETGRWGASGPLDLLSLKASCVNHSSVDPIASLEDLERRFRFAVLAKHIGPSAERWRRENGIEIGGERWVHFPHSKMYAGGVIQGKHCCESDMAKAVRTLLATTGSLATQLNSAHAAAVEIQGVQVTVTQEGYVFHLRYGFDGSSWGEDLASTPNMWSGQGSAFRRHKYGAKSEPFIVTLDRAIGRMKELTAPAISLEAQ